MILTITGETPLDSGPTPPRTYALRIKGYGRSGLLAFKTEIGSVHLLSGIVQAAREGVRLQLLQGVGLFFNVRNSTVDPVGSVRNSISAWAANYGTGNGAYHSDAAFADVAAAHDGVFTVDLEAKTVSYVDTPYTPVPVPETVLCYRVLETGAITLENRPLPFKTIIAIPKAPFTLNNVNSDGITYYRVEALNPYFDDMNVLLSISVDGYITFAGHEMTSSFLERCGVNPEADTAREYATLFRNGTRALVKRDAAIVPRYFEFAHSNRISVKLVAAHGMSFQAPILRRPATPEYAMRRFVKVSGLSEDSAKFLLEKCPELFDAAKLSAVKTALCPNGCFSDSGCHCRAVSTREQRETRAFAEPRYLEQSNWHEISRPLTFRGLRAQPGALSRYIGVEIEVASTNEHGAANEAVKLVKASCVHDGSLPQGGMEIVTQPARGKQFRLDIGNLIKGLNSAGTKVNNSCGLHVHVDGRDLDVFGIQRLAQIWRKVEPAMYDLVAYSRRTNHYSKPCSAFLEDIAAASDGKELREALYQALYQTQPRDAHQKKDLERRKKQKHGGERYYGLNLHSWFMRRTVEFRLHQGCLDAKKIIAFGEICGWLMQQAASMTSKAIEALPENPGEALLKLLPRDLRTFTKRRTNVLARYRPGYVKPAKKGKQDASVAPSNAPVVTPAVEPANVVRDSNGIIYSDTLRSCMSMESLIATWHAGRTYWVAEGVAVTNFDRVYCQRRAALEVAQGVTAPSDGLLRAVVASMSGTVSVPNELLSEQYQHDLELLSELYEPDDLEPLGEDVPF